jgi:cell division ATPase FtsA
VFAELGHKMYTGIGISFGAGMVNFCYSVLSQPISSFALVNSGDWIDQQAAAATNEPIAVINREKTKIDLRQTPTNLVERAIQSQYRIMVEKTVQGIKEAVLKAGGSIKPDEPVDIILGGGTASPPGFPELVREVIAEVEFPMPVGEVKRPEDHLYAVARGCLIAAENAQ